MTTKTVTSSRFTGTPARRAASRFEPDGVGGEADPGLRQHEPREGGDGCRDDDRPRGCRRGSRSRSSRSSSLGTWSDSGPTEMSCAMPIAMPSVPSVTMNDGIRRRVVIRPFTSPAARTDRAARRGSRATIATRVAEAGGHDAGHDVDADDAREHEDGADRQVDLARDEHERGPDRDDEDARAREHHRADAERREEGLVRVTRS